MLDQVGQGGVIEARVDALAVEFRIRSSADGRLSPEIIGIAVMGLLDRSWYAVQTQSVPVDRAEVIAVIAETITAMAATPDETRR